MKNQTAENNKRIAKNTIMLYLRMFLTMVVGLYTSRVVLQTLGVEDYGIYGVVGGIVAMMGFLNASMSGATSRFLTFELGRKDTERLFKTFSTALVVHIIIAIVVFVFAETIGLWFLCNKLVIPESRIAAAHWVYQLSILSAMFSITQVPYNSCIIAHENFDVYAYVEILNVTLKLLIVYLLLIGNYDKLILYAILTFVVTLLIMFIYRFYCIRKYKECRFKWIWDKEFLMPMISFSGWDLYGNFCYTARQQGAGFVLNFFYGVTINAACGIASTVQGVMLNFSTNVITAIKPQIIKKYASRCYDEMNSLIITGTKMTTALLLIVTAPLYSKIDYALKLWLSVVPIGTVFMSKMLLILNIITSVNLVAIIGIHASGKMKLAGGLNGTLLLSCIPLMYVLLKFGYGYDACYVLFVLIGFVYFGLVIYVLKKQVKEFSMSKYFVSAIIPVSLTSILSFAVTYLLSLLFVDTFIQFLAYILVSLICVLLIAYIMLLNRQERNSVENFIISKIFHKK